ncbi:MAG: MmgE/PrpD family protein [Phycisphaerales bacterium]|nr:MmgE/PrpD family protein [Phycisphaerales bacterium]
MRKHGWDHVCYGALSSALAAAKLWGLSAEQMVHTLGIAGVCNFATRQTRTGQLSMWKACAFSNAARNGVFAASLAREGMTGPNEIYEGPKGLFRMITGPFKPAWAGSPDDWMILRTYIKFWPAEYHSQSAIDAALQLRSEIGDPMKIESLLIESFEAAVSIIGSEPEKWRPTSRETADHSMGYCVAVALLDGDVTRASFSDERLRDSKVLALLDRIRIVETDACNANYPKGIPNNLIFKLSDGRTLSKRVDYPRGHAGNPMTDDEVVAKFNRLADGVVSRSVAQRIVEQCMGFEKLTDVAQLLEFDVA